MGNQFSPWIATNDIDDMTMNWLYYAINYIDGISGLAIFDLFFG